MLMAYRHWLSGTILGAFESGSLIGIAGLHVSPYKRSQHRGQIFTVYVREDDQGKGVGDRLIKEILAPCRGTCRTGASCRLVNSNRCNQDLQAEWVRSLRHRSWRHPHRGYHVRPVPYDEEIHPLNSIWRGLVGLETGRSGGAPNPRTHGK
ncbi:GNAT family N-acetyltransferase [Bradyrhizobium diazoefficiens]|nr:GNAT family N-acetyltransferase [Bradyrhizobium diazoefficiens]MBR0886031.1 GNAT family N-acetyltransferase [Bradyrhizobium diazoefficiens]MBR0917854.1 GNAT family N-acetyltransferase [Bradyrhizobium diazoefficiens]